VAWLPYVVGSYLNLSLPLAPAPRARDALTVAAAAGSVLLVFPALPVVLYGHAPAFIVFGCALAAVLAGIVYSVRIFLLLLWYTVLYASFFFVENHASFFSSSSFLFLQPKLAQSVFFGPTRRLSLSLPFFHFLPA